MPNEQIFWEAPYFNQESIFRTRAPRDTTELEDLTRYLRTVNRRLSENLDEKRELENRIKLLQDGCNEST